MDATWRTRSPSAAQGRYPALGRPHPPPLFRGAWIQSRPRDAAAPPARGGPCLAVSQVDGHAPAGLVRGPPPPPGLVGRAPCCELALLFITSRRRLADQIPVQSEPRSSSVHVTARRIEGWMTPVWGARRTARPRSAGMACVVPSRGAGVVRAWCAV